MSTIERFPRTFPCHAAIILLTLGALPPVAAQPATKDAGRAQEIVDRAIAHHGGELYEASETRLTVTSKSGSFRIVSRVDGDRFEHTVVAETPDGERRVRVTNDAVSHHLAGEAVPVPSEQEPRLRDFVNARIYFPFLPYRLNDPSVRKEYLGRETWDGEALEKVKVTFEAGSSTDAQDEYLYWFDPASGRLVQFAYSFESGDGGLRLRRGFDYRRVGGLLFFDAENLGVGGHGRSVEEITPGFVAEEMRQISTVKLSEITVEELD